MENLYALPQTLLSIILLSAGVILFLVTRKVIEQWAIFRGMRAAVAALSITCLVVASLALSLVIPGNDPGDSGRGLSVNFALLPGVAVAGTIALIELFVIAGATTSTKTDDATVGEIVHKSTRSGSSTKPKQKSKTSPKPSKETAKTPVEAAKKT